MLQENTPDMAKKSHIRSTFISISPIHFSKRVKFPHKERLYPNCETFRYSLIIQLVFLI